MKKVDGGIGIGVKEGRKARQKQEKKEDKAPRKKIDISSPLLPHGAHLLFLSSSLILSFLKLHPPVDSEIENIREQVGEQDEDG